MEKKKGKQIDAYTIIYHQCRHGILNISEEQIILDWGMRQEEKGKKEIRKPTFLMSCYVPSILPRDVYMLAHLNSRLDRERS